MNHDTSPTTSEFPLILLKLGYGALFVLLVGGLLLAVALSRGLADPPKAGPLQREIGPYTVKALAKSTSQLDIAPLPRPPYTLEVTASLPADVPDSRWGIALNGLPDVETFGVRVSGYGFFSVLPTQPDSIPFIHIRTQGNPNKLTLEVADPATGESSVLRINDEVAWRGAIPQATQLLLILQAYQTESQLVVESVKLYYKP